MKKTLLPILALIPAIWAGATWFTSQNSEIALDEFMAQSNQQIAQTAPFITLEKTSFNKGFIQSSAQSIVTIAPTIFSNETAEPVQIGFKHKIYHGPVMMTPNGIKIGTSYILTTLDQSSLTEEVKSIITSIFGDAEPFVSGVATGLSEMIDTDFIVAPFSVDTAQIAELIGKTMGGEELELSFAGFSGDIASNVEGTKMKGVMNIGELVVKVGDGATTFDVTMAASTVNMDVDELYKGSLLDGNIVLTIPSILFSDGKGSGATFSEVRMSSSAEQDNGLMNGVGIFDVNKIHIKSSKAGFDVPDAKLHTSFDISGIERTGIIKSLDLEQEVRRSQIMMLSRDDADPDALMSSMNTYYRAGGELVKQGARIGYVLDISTDTGGAALRLDLNYISVKRLFSLKTVKDLAVATQGNISVSIDKSMLAGTPLAEAISMPVGMGFAVEKADRYESLVLLDKGELLLNGNPVPFLDAVGDQPLLWDELLGM